MQNTFSNIIFGLEIETIPLEQATKVRMMNRIDKKYWFHISELPALFKAIKNDYFIQTVAGCKWQQYETKYFDTPDNKMYTLHHNGKLNRYKIRYRDYMNSGDRFLEVKFKTNKGRTIKKRVESTSLLNEFNVEESEFLRKRTIFGDEQLDIALKNKFTRLTLINKKLSERCTIDIDLTFMGKDKTLSLDELVILEHKSEKESKLSPIKVYLRDARLMPSGFSKYCIGRALTDTHIKRNRFKQKIRDIGKMIDKPDLYNI